MPASNPTAPPPGFNTQLHFLLGRGRAPSVEAAAYPARGAITGETVFLRLRAEHAEGVEATLTLSSDERAALVAVVDRMAQALAGLPPSTGGHDSAPPAPDDREGRR